MKILVTGGAGFIGSALIRFLISESNHKVVNLDKLTYAGDLRSVEKASMSKRYFFEKVDINDRGKIREILKKYQPNYVMHLAAESHVDNSIEGPRIFLETNFMGTYNLLEEVRNFYEQLSKDKKKSFRFLHISTDEVYGDIGNKSPSVETDPYNPSSPYSASKASSDHLARAWHRTYRLPTIVTNCSNNYGPYQYPEKLIPTIINNALLGRSIPVYGNGAQVRDWLYVDDHVKALFKVLISGKVGSTYNIGGFNELKNIEVVNKICSLLDDQLPENKFSRRSGGKGFKSLITYVEDRPGHDKRYAINAKKIKLQLGWKPTETFESGINKTINWYLNNQDWLRYIQQKSSQKSFK